MQLYTLLAGPILRRVDPAKVCIWLATSIQPEGLDVAVFPLRKTAGVKGWSYDAVLPTTTVYNVHQLGGRLFVILLEVSRLDPEDRFAPLTPYGYELMFRFRAEDKVVFDQKHLLSREGGPKAFNFTSTYSGKERPYTYADLPFPVFVVPAQDGYSARIFYGSCRKTHGPGSDALNAADKLLERDWRNYDGGPVGRLPDFSLFHLGDQIYADDLVKEVFDAVRGLADLLMGYEEEIPEFPGIGEITQADLTSFLYRYLAGEAGYRIEDLNLPTRVEYVSEIWPGYREVNVHRFLCHYMQVYVHVRGARDRTAVEDLIRDQMNKAIARKAPDLVAAIHWNIFPVIDVNEVLPREFVRRNLSSSPVRVRTIPYKSRREFVRRNSHISTVDDGHLLTFGEFAALYLINWSRIGFIENNSPAWASFVYRQEKGHNLEGVLERNRRVARLFANVPSYMIFDDHEITDEWNLDETWRHTVERRSPTGRRLVANGLAAFWAFQGWGNDPSAFPAGLIDAIKQFLLEPVLPGGARDPGKARRFEDAVIGFQDWAFITPTSPRAVFLDSRTLRHGDEDMSYYPELNHNKRYKAARLMSPLAFDKIAQLLKAANYRPDTPIIFCAATPIFGSKLFELGQVRMVDGSFNSAAVIARFRPRKPGRHDNDFESWSASPRGKYEFLKFLEQVRPSKVAVLSGDVHYACHASLQLVSAVTGRSIAIEQLTSSALKNNTVEYLEDIDLLAYLSTVDTKDEEYKKIEENYPMPDVAGLAGAPVPHFRLRGHLVPYSRMIDPDSWIIFSNNLGLLHAQSRGGSVRFTNYFLGSPGIDAETVIAAQLPVP